MAGVAVLGIGFLYFMATYVVPRALVTLTKAAPATRVSFKTSLILGEKILAKADGKDSCIVNVFVMDDSGKGVAGKRVEMEAEGVKVTAKTEVTDKDGKMSFEITSTEERQYKVTATVEGVPLSRSLIVTFRN